MNLPPALRPSRLSPRARYVTGGLVGALMATSLVMLGTVLPYGDHGGKQNVTLTGSEGEVADGTVATETTATTETTEAPKPVDTTLPLPTAAQVPERVVGVEDRVGKVESRVDKLETTTTTVHKITLEDCTSTQVLPRGSDHCVELVYPSSTTTTYLTTTTRAEPVWTTSVKDGQVTITLIDVGGFRPQGVTTLTFDDGSKLDVPLRLPTQALKAGQTATWTFRAEDVLIFQTSPAYHMEYRPDHRADGTITAATDVTSASKSNNWVPDPTVS